jgi:hypothetical protein
MATKAVSSIFQYEYQQCLQTFLCSLQQVPSWKDCINNLTHSLLQQGDDIRQRSYVYGARSGPTKDLTSTSSGDGRKKRADAKLRTNHQHPQQLLMGRANPCWYSLEHNTAATLSGMGLYHW